MIQTGETAAARSLLAFWAAAGIDSFLCDEPQDRLVPVAPPPVLPGRSPPRSDTPGDRPATEADIARARQQALACASLDDLAEAIRQFDGCRLKSLGAHNTVTFRGNTDPDVLVIGDAPDADDDRESLPFVSDSGRFMERMLAWAGLRENVLLTNSVFWCPPGGRAPTQDEQAPCAPFLHRLIALSDPKVILILGEATARSMLQTNSGILGLAGRWHQWRPDTEAGSQDREYATMVSFSPAFTQNSGSAKRRAWSAILSLADRVERPPRTG